MPVVVVIVAAVIVGILVTLVTARFPAMDPSAPHASPTTVARDVRAHPVALSFVRSRLNTEETTGLLLTTALAIALAAAIAIGSLFLMVQHNAFLAHYDLSAARWGADHATPWSTQVLRDISLLGGTPVMIAVAVVVAVVEFARSRRTAVFGFIATVVIGQVVLMNLTKFIVDRPRPNIDRLTGFSGSSFPSGHATAAAATFAAAAFLIGRGRSRHAKALCAGAAATLAVAVATTRVLLGVHWFTDVLAGVALGWGWFAVTSVAFGGRVLRFGQPVAVAQATPRAPVSVGRTPAPGGG